MSADNRYVFAAKLDEVRSAGCLVAHVEKQTLALFFEGGAVYAIENACPHMGFPLHRGTVKDCVLTCHWHHARFDLKSGGTFDPWADDARAFPVEIRDGEVWVDTSPRADQAGYLKQRLADGLRQDLSLVIAKSTIALASAGEALLPFRTGLNFGVEYRRAGWGQGLTILTCMQNLLPVLNAEDRPRALYHGLSAVSRDCAGSPPRIEARPLPGPSVDAATLKRWFRDFVEVRNAEGAERCIVTAVAGGASRNEIADMLFAAVTDHRYISTGHPLDFTNKALEALDLAGWDNAGPVLGSLIAGYASAGRMEESNAWRNPIDLVAILQAAFEEIPAALAQGRPKRGKWDGRKSLVQAVLGESPQQIAEALLAALREGCSEEELASAVTFAAALRIARFAVSNEFGDWDTALHTFTFANAVQHGLRRTLSSDLLRGVFDAAMSVYLDRFLNMPAARIPEPKGKAPDPKALLAELSDLMDRQHQVNESGAMVAEYLASGGNDRDLLATLGGLLLREDRDFHTIQAVEAAFRQYSYLRGSPDGAIMLIAAARYLAAHTPTMRSQGQTYQIARKLSRGELLFEE
ncbi:MAG TPA: Rieske (2Fe-2S) protein [Capsulimonadaceae bacterium]|nr:Rieske (2Fe-2S) protein [Capsulimonadaceae bacterium]